MQKEKQKPQEEGLRDSFKALQRNPTVSRIKRFFAISQALPDVKKAARLLNGRSVFEAANLLIERLDERHQFRFVRPQSDIFETRNIHKAARLLYSDFDQVLLEALADKAKTLIKEGNIQDADDLLVNTVIRSFYLKHTIKEKDKTKLGEVVDIYFTNHISYVKQLLAKNLLAEASSNILIGLLNASIEHRDKEKKEYQSLLLRILLRPEKDPYAVLGVSSSATPEELRSAYWRLAKEHHPDRGGDPEKFKSISAAYASLKRTFK